MKDWATSTLAKEIKVWSTAMMCMAMLALALHAFDRDARPAPMAANPAEQVTQ